MIYIFKDPSAFLKISVVNINLASIFCICFHVESIMFDLSERIENSNNNNDTTTIITTNSIAQASLILQNIVLS